MTDVKCGFMQKCGKSVKSWKKRWFVLKSNGYLYYYENKSCKQEKGKIDIVDASKIAVWKEVSGVEKKLPSASSPDSSFGIIVNDRTYTCVCDKQEECWSWLDAIKKVRDSGGNYAYPEATFSKDKPEAASEAPPPVPMKAEPAKTKPTPPPAYNSADQYSQSLPRAGSVHVPATDPGPNFSTMPRRPASAVQPTRANNPGVAPPPLPSSNPYYTPEVAKAQQQATAPPSANPNYRPPPQQPAQASPHQQPHYRPAAPQPQYRPAPPPAQYPPQQPQYRPAPPQPQYRPPPPQPQYRPPPPQPQYRPPPAQYYPPQPQYRPPPPQPQYRPPMQQQYRPPGQQPRPAAPYQPPVRGVQRAPPQPQYRPPVQGQVSNKTTVTVVTTTQIRR